MYQEKYINKPNEPIEYISATGYEIVVLPEEPQPEPRHGIFNNIQAVSKALEDAAKSIMAL